MFDVIVTHSEDIDTNDVIDELLEQACESLGDARPQAGLLFACVDHDYPLILSRIGETFPGIELVGCTTDGELSTVLGFVEDSVSLTLFVSDEVEIVAGVGREVSKGPEASLAGAVEEARARLTKEPVLAIFTPPSLTASGSMMVDGLQKALGEEVPIFGGAAGDQWKFEQTRQFFRDEVLPDGAPFLLFSAPLQFSAQVQSGWQPVASKGTVKRGEKNVVYEIDDMTAGQFYRRYLGEGGTIAHLAELSLAVFNDDGSFYLRAAMVCNEEDGTILFAGDIPEGATVQLSHASRDAIVEATRAVAGKTASMYPGARPTAAITFTCASRKQILGSRTKEEYQILQQNFPDLQLAGFYGYGEIAPTVRGQTTCFHNETFVLLMLGTE